MIQEKWKPFRSAYTAKVPLIPQTETETTKNPVARRRLTHLIFSASRVPFFPTAYLHSPADYFYICMLEFVSRTQADFRLAGYGSVSA